MLKMKGKGGGSSKSRSAGKTKGASFTKTKRLQTQQEHLITLRSCLFDDAGIDRNVLNDFKPFKKFERNGVKAEIEFYTGKGMNRKTKDWMFNLSKDNMERYSVYSTLRCLLVTLVIHK